MFLFFLALVLALSHRKLVFFLFVIQLIGYIFCAVCLMFKSVVKLCLHVSYYKCRRWRDNIKMHLKEIVCENQRRPEIAQDFCPVVGFGASDVEHLG